MNLNLKNKKPPKKLSAGKWGMVSNTCVFAGIQQNLCSKTYQNFSFMLLKTCIKIMINITDWRNLKSNEWCWERITQFWWILIYSISNLGRQDDQLVNPCLHHAGQGRCGSWSWCITSNELIKAGCDMIY